MDHSQKKLLAFFNANAESAETAQDRETGRNNADEGPLGGAIRQTSASSWPSSNVSEERKFQSKWLTLWPWLTYENDAM